MAEKAKALALGAIWQCRAVSRQVLRCYRTGGRAAGKVPDKTTGRIVQLGRGNYSHTCSSRTCQQPAIHGIEPHLVVSSLRGRCGLVSAPIRKTAVLTGTGPGPPLAQQSQCLPAAGREDHACIHATPVENVLCKDCTRGRKLARSVAVGGASTAQQLL